MTESQEKFLEILRSYLGRSYRYGELDCSFLVLKSLQELKNLGLLSCELNNENNRVRSAIWQAARLGKIVTLDYKLRIANAVAAISISPPDFLFKNLEIGDLLFFRGTEGHYDDGLFNGKKVDIGHVVIYSGGGMAIHAAGGKIGKVIEEKLGEIIERIGPIIMIKKVLEEK